MDEDKQSGTKFEHGPRLVPSRYLSVFWGERRLGIRLRRVWGLMGMEEGKIAVKSGMDLQIQSLRCYQLGHLAFTHF